MKIPFMIGETVVHAVVQEHLKPVPTMIHVHEDEKTAFVAGADSVARLGGRLIGLNHAGTRLILFSLAGKRYAFDPNRIFSDAGIKATLIKQSEFSLEAHAVIKQFATAYLDAFALEKEAVIIALHNTVDGLFSVENFGVGADLSADAAAVHISRQRNRFDFFYVTVPAWFDYLKGRDFNVVLQNNSAVTDDGSLSVLFSKRGVPYINIEAQIARAEEQARMIGVVREMIGK